MSRKGLLELLNGEEVPPLEAIAPRSRPTAHSTHSADRISPLSPGPDCDFEWDEMTDSELVGPRVEDDVNGLSLALDTSHTSFQGASSIPTMIRTIFRCSTSAQNMLQEEKLKRHLRPSNATSNIYNLAQAPTLPNASEEGAFIDAYFNHVHAIAPMVDEADFRRARVQGVRDSQYIGPWFALMNMVLALGYVAYTGGNQTGHLLYYRRASKHLDFSCLGTGHLYTVQALSLLGGHYLHYLNRPNTAHVVMGAALRMAVAIGLHRSSHQYASGSEQGSESHKRTETRIRTWWSLFCLDVWAGTTLGRPDVPSLDNGTITTSSPILASPLVSRVDEGPLASRWHADLSIQDYNGISLRASEQFCKIAAHIQHRMAVVPLLAPPEITDLDSKVLNWQNSLHPLLRDAHHCPEVLRSARALLRCRLCTLRLALYRPHLVNAALNRGPDCPSSETTAAKDLIRTCRNIAVDTIDTIAADWFPNQISAWHSVWHMFQAALVLLLALITEPENTETQLWDQTLQRATDLLHQMERWCPGASRSGEVVRFLYSARGPSSMPAEELLSICLSDNAFDDLLNMDMMNAETSWIDFDTLGSPKMPEPQVLKNGE